MAFDGTVLNSPSDPTGERPVKEALLVFYTGVYAPPAMEPVVSPNGDGIAERQSLSYKIVRPSTVSAQLFGPDGKSYYTDSGPRAPGVYKVAWPTSGSAPLVQGRWQWVVQATDDQGQRSAINRGFTVNNTLGFLRPTPPGLAAPRLQPRTVATVSVTRPATILSWIETPNGVPIVNLASRRAAAGTVALDWDGRNRNGSVVYPGRYVLKIAANNSYGRVELETKITVVKARPKPIPKKRPGR
jgi:hypothetical protein